MAINFQKTQNAMNHTKELAGKLTYAWVHFSHTHSPTYTHTNVYTHIWAHTHLTLTLWNGMGKIVCVCVCELTRRSKWCPISYLSAPRVYLPGYIIICWPSHMIWEREVQNSRHPRESSQDVMRDTGLWPNTLRHTSTCTIWPPNFLLQISIFPLTLKSPNHSFSFDFCHPLLPFI